MIETCVGHFRFFDMPCTFYVPPRILVFLTLFLYVGVCQ